MIANYFFRYILPNWQGKVIREMKRKESDKITYNDEQKFVTATIADMKRVLNKFWDCQCTATVIVSSDRDFFAERSGRAERRSSQTFMMVNGYIMRTEPGKPSRETAATPAKGS